MTLANRITVARIGLIPVFVGFAIYYSQGIAAGRPEEWLRWAALGVFALAAASDGLDGYVARRYNQRTELGAVLDPIADKGLLLAAILTLSFSSWRYALPVWFGVLVVARDLIVMTGAVVLVLLQRKVAVRPTWSGKAATALQMTALIAVMLQPDALLAPVRLNGRTLQWVWLDLPVFLAAFFTLASGVGYSALAIAQVHLGGHGDPLQVAGGGPGRQAGSARTRRRLSPTAPGGRLGKTVGNAPKDSSGPRAPSVNVPK
jgi:CDP-diacylglycerol--glycerol-3-phosphate 3-phosphatidyltransferase